MNTKWLSLKTKWFDASTLNYSNKFCLKVRFLKHSYDSYFIFLIESVTTRNFTAPIFYLQIVYFDLSCWTHNFPLSSVFTLSQKFLFALKAPQHADEDKLEQFSFRSDSRFLPSCSVLWSESDILKPSTVFNKHFNMLQNKFNWAQWREVFYEKRI